jgi:hypothetical protein
MARDESAKVNLTFRMPEGLRVRLESAAAASNRSINSEMIARLESSFEGGDVLRALFGAGQVTAELVKSLLEILGKVQRIAKNKGLKEAETRQMLRAAFDHLGSVYFYAGEPIPSPPEGYTGSMDRPPVHLSQMPLAAIGYEVANSVITWNDDLLLDEWGDGKISNFWTGDGKEREPVGEPQTIPKSAPEGQPLSNVLRGDNRADPVAPASASEDPAKPARRRARFISRGPRFHARRDPSRAHQTAH